MRMKNLKNNLKFSNGKFRVLLIGDPHEIQNDSTKKDKDRLYDYLNFQYTAVEELKPQLVILMGDNAQGNNEDELKKTLLRITKPYADNKIPFAFVLGNHDLECAVSDIQTQYNIYRQLPYCILPDENEVNKYGDYNVEIKSEFSDKTAYNFRLIYSGSKASANYYSHYAFVNEEQIQLNEGNTNKLKKTNGKTIPSVVIQHIPVPEVFSLLKEKSFMSMLFDGVYGQNEKKGKFYALDKKNADGYMGEAPCTAGYNSGQFASWKKMGDVKAAFFGHDHMNDFCGKVDSILLGQCKTAGFRPYGDGLMQAVRVVDIFENETDKIDTHMVYYRDLVGNNCKSIHGAEKVLRDRTSVKIDAIKTVSKFVLPIVLPLTLYKIIGKIKQ